MTIDSVPELARRVRHLETLVKRGKPADGSDNASLLKRISALESSVARIGKAAPTKPQVYTPKPAVRVPKPTDNSLALKLAALEREVERLRVKERPVGAWQSYTPTWTAATTNPSIGNGTLSGRYIQIGTLVYCQFTMRAGSTTTFGSGIWRFSYPVAPNTTYANLYQVGSIYALDNGAANYNGITQYAGATYMSLIISGNWVSATAPFTWANGDYLEVNTIYEAA